MSQITVRNEAGEEQRLTIRVTFTRPFCAHKKKASAANDAVTGMPTILHELPHCERFQTLGAIDYLRAARLAGAVTIPEPS